MRILGGVLLWLWLLLLQDSPQRIKHLIRVVHPGIESRFPLDYELVEMRDKAGKPLRYSMEVESVVCGDEQCRVDRIGIIWDKFGSFENLSLPVGTYLEKAEGIPFAPEDYQRLEQLLQDPYSPLRTLSKYELVGTLGSEGVDALSGATILLEKSAYVSGAVWTCYSLWHWVYGAARDSIRQITAKSMDGATLSGLLFSPEIRIREFALEQVTARRDYASETLDAVSKAVVQQPGLLVDYYAYWEGMPDDGYWQTGIFLLENLPPLSRIDLWRYIARSERYLPEGTLDDLVLPFSSMEYVEIDAFLDVLERKNAASSLIIHRLIPLLGHQNVLIARRVNWFLKTRTLNPDDGPR
ncbi:hypothetical protein J0A68_20630 [Algoriphagus sp. H41]|uniref:Uncharacterized protein n=1 Tax=Algoriphagus oliviformis TaxID=2811231 RepID=A0ABS3C8F3_9BACT|nr:hypothetical protein [Algoriphagus oliviformis]MBN7813373.1 hypothetical protein [Algoriphagus oliviformis]